ncbi:MAG: FAD-dependent oxidoreductase [bacterium]
MKQYESWGRYPKAKHTLIIPIFSRSEIPCFKAITQPVLPYAQGRSYGDVCLNDGGILLDTEPLSRFIAFDNKHGIIRCEAGVTLAEILKLIVPSGWFLPVTPGTQYVSVGGAIANDVHGKNHHKAGTFGCHVKKFELLRSSGDRLICSPSQNAEIFRATIGGLGLTGLILWAEFQLIPIPGPFIEMERICFATLEEFFEISTHSDQNYQYTVGWVDCLAQGDKLGRGVFLRGNHTEGKSSTRPKVKHPRTVRVPCDFPAFLLNRLTMKAFNNLYYYTQMHKQKKNIIYFKPFFYPLDSILMWNRLYGKRGFFQYQCVVPFDDYEAIRTILIHVTRGGKASFLAVLKKFGNIRSLGMLSFPKPGVTLSLDFPYRGIETLRLLDELDEIVGEARGSVYPAKDARMSAKSFQKYFPQWKAFSCFIDPKFTSSFWRRVAVSSEENNA